MFRLSQTCFLLLLLHGVASEVFLNSDDANQVLNRQRRANSPFEEWRQGDMERECIEERCDREEAREIFEDDKLTTEFWNKYYDGDACVSKPCVHNGVCKDGIGMYTCFCLAGFKGYNCEIAIPELCENNNGDCDHFCHVKKDSVQCSCADGYYLDTDDKSCLSNEAFKCGFVVSKKTRTIFIYQPNTTATNTTENTNMMEDPNVTKQREIPFTYEEDVLDMVKENPVIAEARSDKRIVDGEECPPGECPWQAFLVNHEDRGFCGGTILNKYFILTAAHCMNQTRSFYVVLGEFDTEVKDGQEAIHQVEQVFIHRSYISTTYHNDISLVMLKDPIKFTQYILPACLPERDFAEKVLMKRPDGLVSGFGRVGEAKQPSTILLRLTVPYVPRATCLQSSQHKISNRMFCAGYDKEKKDACQGDSGGPHVTRYGETWFVTGVVSWGEGCAREGKYGIYTQVSKYIDWIRAVMGKFLPKEGGKRKTRGAGRMHSMMWV
ncbi:LOW QUALITY PROTEIN: coagulation factor X [Salmo salar]|uniref:coagulation factor Xa n=1 Tax=Salmo salar TaxID=8030 RepID=A0A1S3MXE9_SALSA|nr:LOW QUALITY PROTEIN: coagulation factor X [Salmo salar]|eukprot:XP_014007903.1 PREDICTED: coagulation factor X-like [Salmo salar]